MSWSRLFLGAVVSPDSANKSRLSLEIYGEATAKKRRNNTTAKYYFAKKSHF